MNDCLFCKKPFQEGETRYVFVIGGSEYHLSCQKAIIWQHRAEEYLEMLDKVMEVSGITSSDMQGIIEMRNEGRPERKEERNKAWRVFADLDTMRRRKNIGQG